MIISIPLWVKRSLYVTCENDCCLFTANDNCVHITKCANLYSIHQEADSKMLFHVASISSPANVVIKSIGTGICHCLPCLSTTDPRKKVWMETGVESKNSLRYININQI